MHRPNTTKVYSKLLRYFWVLRIFLPKTDYNAGENNGNPQTTFPFRIILLTRPRTQLSSNHFTKPSVPDSIINDAFTSSKADVISLGDKKSRASKWQANKLNTLYSPYFLLSSIDCSFRQILCPSKQKLLTYNQNITEII